MGPVCQRGIILVECFLQQFCNRGWGATTGDLRYPQNLDVVPPIAFCNVVNSVFTVAFKVLKPCCNHMYICSDCCRFALLDRSDLCCQHSYKIHAQGGKQLTFKGTMTMSETPAGTTASWSPFSIEAEDAAGELGLGADVAV